MSRQPTASSVGETWKPEEQTHTAHEHMKRTDQACVLRSNTAREQALIGKEHLWACSVQRFPSKDDDNGPDLPGSESEPHTGHITEDSKVTGGERRPHNIGKKAQRHKKEEKRGTIKRPVGARGRLWFSSKPEDTTWMDDGGPDLTLLLLRSRNQPSGLR